MLLLKHIPAAGRDMYEIHSERGQESVRRVVEMLAGHDINHTMQIEQRLPGS